MYLGAEWIWNLTLNLRSPQFYDKKTDNTTAALMLAQFNVERDSVHTLRKRKRQHHYRDDELSGGVKQNVFLVSKTEALFQ